MSHDHVYEIDWNTDYLVIMWCPVEHTANMKICNSTVTHGHGKPICYVMQEMTVAKIRWCGVPKDIKKQFRITTKTSWHANVLHITGGFPAWRATNASLSRCPWFETSWLSCDVTVMAPHSTWPTHTTQIIFKIMFSPHFKRNYDVLMSQYV